jgi:hypothetical protein
MGILGVDMVGGVLVVVKGSRVGVVEDLMFVVQRI